MAITGVNNTDYSNALLNTGSVDEGNDSNISTTDAFKKAVDDLMEANRLTPKNIKNEEDWRKMTDKEWDKLIDHIDKYIDDSRQELERMKEIQEEAAMKMAAEAPANMKTIAASNAALKASANGIVDGCENDFTLRERESWTYDMQTDDQVILATAKMANEYAADMMTKSQEIAITDNTNIGITETVNGVESATVDEDKDKNRIWTVTAFSQDGIISKRFQNGKELDGWEIKFKNPSEAKKVLDFISSFDQDSDLKFAGSKEFWEEFLAGKVSKKDLTNVDNVWSLDK